MGTDQSGGNLDRIEKLIVDGHSQLLELIRVNSDLILSNADLIKANSEKLNLVNDKIDRVDKKHDTNFHALYDLLSDTKSDVNKLDKKLDQHLRMPSHF